MERMRVSYVAAGLLVLLSYVGDARAMSAMPYGKGGDPYPLIIATMLMLVTFTLALMLTRWSSNRIVEKLKVSSGVEGLAKALRNPFLASRAAKALGESGDVRAVEPLLMALHDSNSCVRIAAARALGEIGDPRSEGELMMAMHDEYHDVRECARYALQKLHRSG